MPNVNKIKRTLNRNRLKILLTLLFISLFALYILKKDPPGNNPSENTPQTSSKTVSTPTPALSDPTLQNLLQTQVQKLPGNYSVVIKDLGTNQTYSTKQNQKIPTASVYKLAVMYKTFDAIENGMLKKDQILSGQITTEDALEQMITISDNESALLLAEKLGWKEIDTYLKDEGIDGFNLMVKDYPTTTAAAVSTLLEKIYRKTAVSRTASENMLALLFKQQKNDRIPVFLPKDIKVAHKTGELDNFRHDAGIVFGKKSDYIFVFLTETPVPQDAYINIANLTKTMFEALEKD